MNTEKSIQVVLIDDDIEMHEIVSSVIHLAKDIELIGIGSHGKDALNLCKLLHPDMLLLDVMMPVMNGIEAAHILKVDFPEVKILVLSSVHDHESVQAMLENGAAGYIDKSYLFRDLAETIRAVFHGQKVFSSAVFSHLAVLPSQTSDQHFNLSEREMEILRLMAAGLTKPEIAAKVGIHQTTVKFHSQNVLRKLGVNTRSEALIVAAKNGLI